MRKNLNLLPVILSLFDGGAAAGGSAGGGAPAAEGTGAAGENQGNAPGVAGRGKSGDKAAQPRIVYGKQPKQEQASGYQVRQTDAGAANGEEGKDLSAEFKEAINGKYKDAFSAEVQRIIDRRFKEAKATEASLSATKPLTDMLFQRYGITDGSMDKLIAAVEADDPTLSQRAEDNGLSVEQQRKMDAYERENRRLRALEEQRATKDRADAMVERFKTEGAELLKEFPDIDLRAEVDNPKFLQLFHSGIPVRDAYFALHRDEIMQTVQQRTAASTEKRVTDSIRANGMRPRENATSSSQGAFIQKADPRKLTKEDHDRIRERVRRGERIVF